MSGASTSRDEREAKRRKAADTCFKLNLLSQRKPDIDSGDVVNVPAALRKYHNSNIINKMPTRASKRFLFAFPGKIAISKTAGRVSFLSGNCFCGIKSDTFVTLTGRWGELDCLDTPTPIMYLEFPTVTLLVSSKKSKF